MRALNLLTAAEYGGIEILCRDIGLYSDIENAFCFLFGEGPIYDQMLEKRIPAYSLSRYPKLSVKRFVSLLKIARQYDCILIHHGDPYLEMYYFALRFFLKDKKFIAVVHSCYDETILFEGYGKIKKTIFRELIATLLRVSDRVVFVSQAGYESYKQKFDVDSNKIRIIYNGVGIDKLEDGKNAEVNPGESLKLLYIGRLVKIKGIQLLLEAISRLVENVSLELIIVGDGEERQHLEDMATSLGIREITQFCGARSNVGDYLKKADIFVYPSVCQEIFGISIVEAMAYGRICVANEVGGIPEIIKDGVNGFLNHTNDAEGLYQTLMKATDVCKDYSKYEEISHAARRTAESFSIAATISKMSDLLNEL